mgnify:FL=1
MKGDIMKSKDYKFAALKHGIYAEKNKGKAEVIRKLNKEEAEYLENIFRVEPYLYKVLMKFPSNFNPKADGIPGFIKSMFFEYQKDHKYVVFKRLTPKQARKCSNIGLITIPYKYKITFV